MAFVRVITRPDYYGYRFACDRCKKEETNLKALHEVDCSTLSQDGSASTMMLCQEYHNSSEFRAAEENLLLKGISGWDHLSHALVLALGQCGFDEGEMKTLSELIDPPIAEIEL